MICLVGVLVALVTLAGAFCYVFDRIFGLKKYLRSRPKK